MISAFLIDTASGNAVQSVQVPSEAYLNAAEFGEGKAFVLFDLEGEDILEYETALVDGEIVIRRKPDDPNALLALARAELQERVKELRNQMEWAGCMTPYGPIDTDPDSQRKIGGGSTAALALGSAFEKEWRMADNTLVILDAAKMIEVGLIVVAHVDACQARKNALDAEIGAAETLADLEAIDVTAAWPA